MIVVGRVSLIFQFFGIEAPKSPSSVIRACVVQAVSRFRRWDRSFG